MSSWILAVALVAAAAAVAAWKLRARPVAKLTLREGSGPGLEFPLPRGRVTIGSEEGRTVVVSHPKVSGLHATLLLEPDRSLLHDRSKRGTRVNGAEVEEAELHSGDLIRLADSIDLIFTRLR
jgi:pSer/pThr/pTyr-binding forkhead associated (FHA) protein